MMHNVKDNFQLWNWVNLRISRTHRLNTMMKVLWFRLYYFFLKSKIRAIRTGPIRISFMLVSYDVWKLHSVVMKMQRDQNFKVSLVLCPFTSQGIDSELRNLKYALKYARSVGVEHYIGHNEFCDADKNLENAHVIYFENPNKHSLPKYHYQNWLHKLTCYSIYSYRISTFFEYEYAHICGQIVWKNFVESEYHKGLSIKYAFARRNIVVSGFPRFEEYFDVPNEVQQDHKVLIIYAPHWTIPGAQNSGLNWSTFLNYHETIISFALENKGQVDLAIKPHPLLKATLSQQKVWGEKKTEEFFSSFKGMQNIRLVQDQGYVDLFKKAEVLLHDSGGFLVEFLALKKPCGFLIHPNISTEQVKERYNKMGRKALESHELINDSMKLTNYLQRAVSGLLQKPKNNNSDIFGFRKEASQEILDVIKKEL